MASRHNIDLERVRVGESQKTRYGSMSRNGMRYRVSISNYPDDTKSIATNRRNRIRVLETIVHEFAHIVLFSRGDTKAKHGERFVEALHDLMVSDWKEIVKIYNFLAQDNLSDDIDLVGSLADDQCFSSHAYSEARRRHASNKNGQ